MNEDEHNVSDDNARPTLVRATSTPVVDVSNLPAPTNAFEAAVYNLVRLTIARARTVRADAFADALKALHAVTPPPSRDANRAAIRQFVQRIETHVLGTLSEAVGQGGVLTCAALMHEHAVWTGSTLSSEHVRRYVDALRAYCTHGTAMKAIAAAFLNYLTSHTLDPENVLVGLRASDRALKELLSAEAMAELLAKREVEDALSRQRLLDIVGAWSGMPRNQVLSAAVSLSARVAEMWQAGDLLVVFMERGRYVFARFAGKRVGNKLLVHISPAELDAIPVELQQCFPIATGIRTQLASGRSALSLTATPIHDFVQECTETLRVGLDELLAQEGAVVELVHRAVLDDGSAVDMSDFYALRHNLAVLSSFHTSTVVRSWFANQRSNLIERSIAFCKQVDVAQLPASSRIRQLRDFARYPLDQLDNTQHLIGRLERAQGGALMQLAKRRDALLRGEVKNQLTSWWLGVIRERVDAFLAQVGYSDVLGHNFLDAAHPPADMNAVRANKKLLDECVDLDTDKHGFKPVLKELGAKIYPAVERFIKEATCTLALLTGMPSPVWPESAPATAAAIDAGLNMNVQTASAACALCGRSTSGVADAAIRDEIQGLARDVQYLVTMIDIEKGVVEANRDVTSIRGLAIGRVVRTLQDLRTAIEVHGGEPVQTTTAVATTSSTDAARDAFYSSAGSTGSISVASDSAKLATSTSGRKSQSAASRFFGSMKGLKSMLGMQSSNDDVPPPSPAVEPYSIASNRSADDNDNDDGDDSLKVLSRLARSRADTESLSAELTSVSLDVQKKLSFRHDSVSNLSQQFDKFFGSGDMLADEGELFESVADESVARSQASDSPPPPAPDEH